MCKFFVQIQNLLIKIPFGGKGVRLSTVQNFLNQLMDHFQRMYIPIKLSIRNMEGNKIRSIWIEKCINFTSVNINSVRFHHFWNKCRFSFGLGQRKINGDIVNKLLKFLSYVLHAYRPNNSKGVWPTWIGMYVWPLKLADHIWPSVNGNGGLHWFYHSIDAHWI